MISYFPSRKGPVKVAKGFIPYKHNTAADLAKIITTYTWSNSVYAQDYRLSDNFLYADLCVLDVDNDKDNVPKYSIEDVKRQFAECKMIIGTTKNHQKSKNGKQPQDRFRVIMQFEKRIECKNQYRQTMNNLMKICDFLDKSCKDAARQWHPCREIVHVQQGDTIPVSMLQPIAYHPSQIAFEDLKKRRRGLSKNVRAFLEHGHVFNGGRNNSIYCAAKNLLEVGTSFNDAISIINSSPFGRDDFQESELINTTKSAYKRA
jgi:hypothetical protein